MAQLSPVKIGPDPSSYGIGEIIIGKFVFTGYWNNRRLNVDRWRLVFGLVSIGKISSIC